MKLNANTNMVHRHLISTNVVKISYWTDGRKIDNNNRNKQINKSSQWRLWVSTRNNRHSNPLTCRYLRRLFATFPWTTLQSPDLNITRFLTRRELNRVWRYLELKRSGKSFSQFSFLRIRLLFFLSSFKYIHSLSPSWIWDMKLYFGYEWI